MPAERSPGLVEGGVFFARPTVVPSADDPRQPAAPAGSMDDATPTPVPPGYAQLRHGVAWFAIPGCAVIHVAGPDAVRFVDAFATAPVAALAHGASSEAMLLDARGQIVALVHVLREGDDVWLVAWPGVESDLAVHLERYHIRERLTVADVSATWEVRGLAGPQATAWLAAARSADARIVPGIDLSAVKIISAAGVWPGGWLLLVPGAAAANFDAACAAAGLVNAAAAAVDAVRIENGYPMPHDIPERALPQELGRDKEAISFTKGCYLGQETVARIDALGHVNRGLVRLASATVLPTGGAGVVAINDDGARDPVGGVTSAAWSADGGSGIALAMVTTKGLAARERLAVGAERVTPVSGRFP